MPLCRERPYAPSMQGLERGTIGYVAALELGVADSFRRLEPAEGHWDVLSTHRKRLFNGKYGLRPLTEAHLIDRLLRVDRNYRVKTAYHLQRPIELYNDLFSHILFPPQHVNSSDDPYSLQVQIRVLIDVLACPVWIDFSIVEWRMRLGEVLWAPPIDNSADNEVLIDDGIGQQLGNQKFWLLVQILLSCELLLRLDARSINLESGLELASLIDMKYIDYTATQSIRWSLILARRWLDNIQLKVLYRDSCPVGRPSPGWLATLTKFGRFGEETDRDDLGIVQIRSRNRERQLSGLLHFATELNWPNIGELSMKVANHEIDLYDNLDQKPTHHTVSPEITQKGNAYILAYLPGQKRGQKRRISCALFPSAGWISNSYISGLILPGEGLNHFLICTLLNNDDDAASILGEGANLLSGFCYSGRSYWSSACVLGRVLAGGKGATECMGWISSVVVPEQFDNCWLDIDTASLPARGKLQSTLLDQLVICISNAFPVATC